MAQDAGCLRLFQCTPVKRSRRLIERMKISGFDLQRSLPCMVNHLVGQLMEAWLSASSAVLLISDE